MEPRPFGNGGEMVSVVIENDFRDTPDPAIQHRNNVDALTGEEIIEIVKNAGINQQAVCREAPADR